MVMKLADKLFLQLKNMKPLTEEEITARNFKLLFIVKVCKDAYNVTRRHYSVIEYLLPSIITALKFYNEMVDSKKVLLAISHFEKSLFHLTEGKKIVFESESAEAINYLSDELNVNDFNEHKYIAAVDKSSKELINIFLNLERSITIDSSLKELLRAISVISTDQMKLKNIFKEDDRIDSIISQLNTIKKYIGARKEVIAKFYFYEMKLKFAMIIASS